MMRRLGWFVLLASSLLLLASGTVWGLDIFGDKSPPVTLVMTSDTTATDANTSILDAILGRDDPSIAEPGLLERPDATIKSSVIQTHLSDLRQLYADETGWSNKIDLSFIWSEAPRPVIKTLCEESGFIRDPAMIFI